MASRYEFRLNLRHSNLSSVRRALTVQFEMKKLFCDKAVPSIANNIDILTICIFLSGLSIFFISQRDQYITTVMS